MNRNSIGLLVVLIIIAGGWYVVSKAPAETPSTTETAWDNGTWDSGNWDSPATTTTATPSAVTITYTDQGFSPASVTIEQGQTVTWVNQSSKDVWVASAMHPTHMAYDGTALKDHCAAGAAVSFDACRALNPGASYSFAFDKVGAWKYHDHLNASKFGTVVVTAPI